MGVMGALYKEFAEDVVGETHIVGPDITIIIGRIASVRHRIHAIIASAHHEIGVIIAWGHIASAHYAIIAHPTESMKPRWIGGLPRCVR
jgi:hypothetical protein